MRRFLGAIFAVQVILCSTAQSGILVGAGYSSTTSGRPVPGLALGYNADKWAVTTTATGVQTPLYYHSAWTLSGYKTIKNGNFGVGTIESGLGFGIFYARRGYRDSTTSALDTADDFNLGPGFRVCWKFLGPASISVEAQFGMRRPLQLIVLSAQDVATVTVGASF